MEKTLIRSILAGISISIGALIFLTLKQVSLPFSAIFFTIGLLIVLWYRFDLYTGQIGYLYTIKQNNIRKMLFILLGNIIGCMVMFAVMGAPTFAVGTLVREVAAAAIITKITTFTSTYGLATFFQSFICGILIYVAVEQHNLERRQWVPFIAIPAFILCGAEHCVADFAYWFASGCTQFWLFIPFILTVIIGNAIGSIVFYRITRKLQK